MELIARGQPRAKLHEAGDVIELRVPTGDREKIVFDLTPNQAFILLQSLQQANIDFFKARREAKAWRDENVLAFPLHRARRA